MRIARKAVVAPAALLALLIVLAPAGCRGRAAGGAQASSPGAGKVLGTWAVDADKMNLAAKGETLPGSNAGVIEERERKELSSLKVVFHDKKEGTVAEADFDGLYVIQQKGEDTGFGGWKSAGAAGGQSAFDMFEAVNKSGSQFAPQGQFKVSGGRATWARTFGNHTGTSLLLRKQ